MVSVYALLCAATLLRRLAAIMKGGRFHKAPAASLAHRQPQAAE